MSIPVSNLYQFYIHKKDDYANIYNILQHSLAVYQRISHALILCCILSAQVYQLSMDV